MNVLPLVSGATYSLAATNGYNILLESPIYGFKASRLRVSVDTGSLTNYVYVLPNFYLADSSGTITTTNIFSAINGRTNAQVSYAFDITNVTNVSSARTTDNLNAPIRPGDYLQVAINDQLNAITGVNYDSLIVEAVRPKNENTRSILCTAVKTTSITDAIATLTNRATSATSTVSLSDAASQFTVAVADANSGGNIHCRGSLTCGTNLTTLATTPDAKRPKVDGHRFNLASIEHIKKYGIRLEAARTDGSNVFDTNFYDMRSGVGS